MIKNKIVLLVDDEPLDRYFFNEVLSDALPEVKLIHATNGNEALELLSTIDELPSYIFMDINMPFMNGFECLKNIKATPKLVDIPVIIYSTSDDIRTKELAKELGAFMFLTKPHSVDILAKKLKSLFS
jgi:CheY-like chemotaxis protein